MANVYDDFDKRQEHDRRFDQTRTDAESGGYTAPKKNHGPSKNRDFLPGLQRDLMEDLLDVNCPRRHQPD